MQSRSVCLGGLLLILSASVIAGCRSTWPGQTTRRSTPHAATTTLTPVPEPILFDDFSYSGHAELAQHGWIVRSAPGWPGVVGASWWQEGVNLVDDPQQPGNRLLRLTSLTDGTGPNTRQTQLCHQRKYLAGTYAARVHFSDAPVSGPDGDQVVQTFYTISPLEYDLDPSYSELDYEYVPNGSIEAGELTTLVTAWETFRPEPNWQADYSSTWVAGSQQGWHTLLMQVAGTSVRFFMDGRLVAEHTEPYYPEAPMSINFNLWFLRSGLLPPGEPRQYQQEIDWVFHAANQVLEPADVERQVARLRASAVHVQDTVPAWNPPLASPCNF